MRKAIHVTLAVLAALGAAQAAQAQGIYKWVDERGRVTYSSTPPPAGREAREVQLPPGPTPDQVEAARARAESLRQQTERMAEERRCGGRRGGRRYGAGDIGPRHQPYQRPSHGARRRPGVPGAAGAPDAAAGRRAGGAFAAGPRLNGDSARAHVWPASWSWPCLRHSQVMQAATKIPNASTMVVMEKPPRSISA